MEEKREKAIMASRGCSVEKPTKMNKVKQFW